ncbi:uncharacterized protein N7496_007187 [Penicillium cataractarum]|uniref:Major facilitator superfamily (MFS) profile domain-containing protein n=1 Tax=Penicillium cataractarum TaxID=2100454 RepID=A0A9W9V993_9EURO|nr:uncharacterized protein N7496_007187 [Penicillium cataractarum]KAJ5371095.1 hypothetical protein N7496_007187 [Penicillium cataractarum]
MASKPDIDHVETVEVGSETPTPAGTARLLDDGEVRLIPIPTRDPCDPLNLPMWHKITIHLTVSFFSMTGILLVSGMGAVLPLIAASYPDVKNTADLNVYPTLFMGIGNLIAMPLSLAIGRRPVYLFSSLLLVIGSIWCAFAPDFNSHLAGRDFLSLGAGQSEGLCVMIVQEMFYLHQRGRALAWFSGITTVGSTALMIASTFICTAWGWRWWYGVFGILNGVVLIFSVLFVVETKYERSPEALRGEIPSFSRSDGLKGKDNDLTRVTTRHLPTLDDVNYSPRSFISDLKPWQGHSEWSAALICYKHMVQIALFPHILWLILCCGAFLGVYVLYASVFSGILTSVPYNFSFEVVGAVMAGQIIVCFVFIPVIGYGTDHLTKYLSKRNGGIVEAEYRLLPLIIPWLVTIASCVIFGRAAADPFHWHWAAVVITYNSEYIGFMSIVLSSFTYAIEAHPTRVGPSVVVLCAMRGFISWGLSWGSLRFVQSQGYEGAFNICAIVLGILGVVGIPIYFFGKKLRIITQRWT